MHTGSGQITQIYLDGSARIDCPPNLIPSPGQYLLAHADASDAPLPVPVFFYDSAPKGFRFAPPCPSSWTIGTKPNLRGPLGHGYSLPSTARKVALIAVDDVPARLHGLVALAMKQEAEIVVVSDAELNELPEVVEVQPLHALEEVCKWADYIAMDIDRENLGQLKKMFGKQEQAAAVQEAQILVRVPMPCGGVADCGVCAVIPSVRHDWKMACKHGPVFVYHDIK